MPTVHQLKYVLAVHQHGHFGRAAESLGVPTLSSQIQKVEHELGVTLFDRHAKPVALTAPGRELIDLARDVVSSHEKLVATAEGTLSEPSGPFSLGIIPTLAPYVLPWFLRDFADRHPAVELSVFERPTDDMLDELGANRLDSGILATPLGELALEEHLLFYDPFYLYAHKRDPILEADAVNVTDIDSAKLWLLEDGHCFRAQVINLCGLDDRSLLDSVRFAGGSFETLRHLIDASGGYTLVPESYARTLSRSARQHLIRPFDERVPTRQVSLVHHRKNWKVGIIDALRASIERNRPHALQTELSEGEILPIRIHPGLSRR